MKSGRTAARLDTSVHFCHTHRGGDAVEAATTTVAEVGADCPPPPPSRLAHLQVRPGGYGWGLGVRRGAHQPRAGFPKPSADSPPPRGGRRLRPLATSYHPGWPAAPCWGWGQGGRSLGFDAEDWAGQTMQPEVTVTETVSCDVMGSTEQRSPGPSSTWRELWAGFPEGGPPRSPRPRHLPTSPWRPRRLTRPAPHEEVVNTLSGIMSTSMYLRF